MRNFNTATIQYSTLTQNVFTENSRGFQEHLELRTFLVDSVNFQMPSVLQSVEVQHQILRLNAWNSIILLLVFLDVGF